MASDTKSSNKWLQRFSAVDLVTISVFVVLYRALWYVWNALAFLFPFNQALSVFFYGLCTLGAYVIVRKVGTATLFAIVAGLINLFLQGEALPIVIVGALVGVPSDLYAFFILKAGRNPFTNTRDTMIISAIVTISWNFVLWVIMLKLIYKMPMENTVYFSVIALSLVTGWIGGWLGGLLGNKVKGLIG